MFWGPPDRFSSPTEKIIAKTIIRICPFRQILSCSNLPTSSVELIWPITELYFRQILSTDFMNRFCQDVKTGPKGGSYGNKILYKNLKFFDKIFVQKSCRRRFRNTPYGEKILLWENLMFGHDFGILVYALLCGGDTKFKLPKAGNGNVFFPNKRVRFARSDKAVALQYHNQRSTDTNNVCGGFTLGVIVGRWTQAQPGKNALLQSFLYTTCITRQADAAPMLWFTDSKTPRRLNSLHRGREVHLDLNG